MDYLVSNSIASTTVLKAAKAQAPRPIPFHIVQLTVMFTLYDPAPRKLGKVSGYTVLYGPLLSVRSNVSL